MIDNLRFALEGGWKVLLAGLVLGAGLPAVFALGVRSLAWATGREPEGRRGPQLAGRIFAGICLLVVIYGVVAGILIIVAGGMGKDVSFTHVWPQISTSS